MDNNSTNLHCFACTLTATISALDMVGAMLLMKREHVLWRGRGRGGWSSFGFFSFSFCSSVCSFTSAALKDQKHSCHNYNTDTDDSLSEALTRTFPLLLFFFLFLSFWRFLRAVRVWVGVRIGLAVRCTGFIFTVSTVLPLPLLAWLKRERECQSTRLQLM